MHLWLKDDDPTATQPWNGQVIKKTLSNGLLLFFYNFELLLPRVK